MIAEIKEGMTAGRRDAFHVPCILAEACDTLKAGEYVVFQDDELTKIEASDESYRGDAETAHGVADPFHPGGDWIIRGELVWVLLVPGTTSGLRHHFDVGKLPEVETHGECGKRCG